MEPLGQNLTTEQKIYLGNLTNHPGYVVLRQLFEEVCNQANARVIKLKPDNPEYDRLLKVYQLQAHDVNDVCATLIKSITMHTIAGQVEDKSNKIKEAAAKVGSVVPELNPGLGSLKIKSPKSDESSNQE